MLKFIANLFGVKHKAPVAPTPYKVEAPVATPKVEKSPDTSTPAAKAKPARKPKVEGEKKPAVKAKTARKPKAPKA